VIEYVGEKIREKVADIREKQYEKEGFGDCYMFKLDSDYVIDASFMGNQARFLNHSCQPNCGSKIIRVNNERKIVFYAKQDINIGTEITYDYCFAVEKNKILCTCGAKNCQGRLN